MPGSTFLRFIKTNGLTATFVYCLVRLFWKLWHLCRGLCQSLTAALTRQMKQQSFAELARHNHWPQEFLNREVLVAGTGPSLCDLNKDILQNKLIIATNEAFYYFREHFRTPDIIILNDFAYAQHEQYRGFLLDLLKAAKTGECQLVIPMGFKPALANLSDELAGADAIPYYYHSFGSLVFYRSIPNLLEFDFSKALPGFPTAGHAAIALGIFLQAKHIYLSGLDLDYILKPHEPVQHANDTEEKSKLSCLDEYQSIRGFNYEKLLKDVLTLLECYNILSVSAKRKNIPVHNLSAKSLIDSFPAIS